MRVPVLRLLGLLCLFAAPALAAGGARFAPFGPGNGIMAVAVDPGSGALYAGFELGGLFRSVDGGRSWTWSGKGLGKRRIKAVAVGAGVMYAGAESSSSHEILGSFDRGATWSLLGTLPRPQGAYLRPGKLVVGGEPGVLYLAISRELWKSADRGRHWSRILASKSWLNVVAAGPQGSREVYVGTAEPGARLLRSADGGATWRELQNGLPAGAVTGLALSSGAGGQPAKIYVGIGRRGLFESADGGATWRQPDFPFGTLELCDVAVDGADPATVYAAYRAGRHEPFRVRISRDGGVTWRSGGLLMAESPPLWGVDLLAARDALYAAGEIDLAASIDHGGTWSYRLRGGAGFGGDLDQVRCAPGDPSTMYALVGTRAFKSVDGGRTWASFAMSLLREGKVVLRDLVVDPARPATLYAVGDLGVFKSSDSGRRWRLWGPPARRLSLLPGGTILAGDCGLMRTTDGGATWVEVLSCRVQDGGQRKIEKILPDLATPGTVFLTVTEETPPPVVRQIYRSRDSGRTWMPIVAGASVLALSPRPPAVLYVVKGDALLQSRDGGDSFRRVGPHLLPPLSRTEPIADLLVDRAAPATLYAGTRGFGLRRSTDGGATWVELRAEGAVRPESQAPGYVFGLFADPARPNVLYAATGGALVRVDL